MSIQRVSNGVVIAPEFKVTRANRSTARFAGAYGGWLMASPGQDVRLTYHEDFLVAEPQANVLLRVNQRVRVSVGAGYRAVAAAKRIDHRLRGSSGSVAVEIGLFSR